MLIISTVSIAKLKKNPNEIYYKKMLLRSGILLIIALYSVTILIQKDYSYYYPAHENSYNSSHDESIQNYNHAPAEAVEEVTEYRYWIGSFENYCFINLTEWPPMFTKYIPEVNSLISIVKLDCWAVKGSVLIC